MGKKTNLLMVKKKIDTH